ncbi:MAG: hypothetical protein LBE95_00860, partial [Holosporaceae bacterium]|nr:hypothetical protein [Holosporaceae bacterium]
MFRKIVKIVKKAQNSHIIRNYRNVHPYVKPYWFRALVAVLITIPVGMMDTAIPWALKRYMDSVTTGNPTTISAYMPFLIVIFSVIQSA